MTPHRSDAEDIRRLRLREIATLRQRIQCHDLQRFALVERLAAYVAQVDAIERGEAISPAPPIAAAE